MVLNTTSSDVICNKIVERAEGTAIYTRLGKSVVDIIGFFSDLSEDYYDLTVDIKRQIENELKNTNLGFETPLIDTNFMFSNKTFYSHKDLFVDLQQYVIIVFLSTNSLNGYDVDCGDGNIIIPSEKGKIVLFDPQINFIQESEICESFQLLLRVYPKFI
jgi:hypothetical protein